MIPYELQWLDVYFRVKGLPTKKKYRFRILAENLAGPGKPSTDTDPVLVKDPIGMSPFEETMQILKVLMAVVHITIPCTSISSVSRSSMGSWQAIHQRHCQDLCNPSVDQA